MKMGHVTIQSAEYEKSVEFYKEIVGLTVQNVLSDGIDITFLSNGEGETAIEIIDGPDRAYQGSGISIGFACDDVVSYREELKEKGYDPTPMISPNPKMGFFFIYDPDGVQIQFMGNL